MTKKIEWKKEYKREFICPKCGQSGLKLKGHNEDKKRLFQCPSCSKKTSESCNVKKKKPFLDPNKQTIWIRGQKVENFVCPKCGNRSIVFCGITQSKKIFRCQICNKLTPDSLCLSHKNLSRYGHQDLMVKPFVFEDDLWDIRSISSSARVDQQNKRYIVHFESFQLTWLKYLVKKYIYHLCKLDKSAGTIARHLDNFRVLSRYLGKEKINNIDQINRGVILDFLHCQATAETVRERLHTLKDFFRQGTIQGWFKIDQDLIRDGDYPKSKPRNPDPISDNVREKIEKNLYKLPDSIARMWIIAFFTAMRPSELALLKKDCLVQEGANWKIVWTRKKVKDQHEVPVTRAIALIVQEQQEYINNLWGENWDYLFCHYQNISATDPNQPNLKPVPKIIPRSSSPLHKCVRCLIKAENIRDENGELAEFHPSLVRPTRLTQLFEQGHDLAVVSAWAGHKRLETTSLYYTKVSCELIQKEVGHIQTALFNISGKPLYYESIPKTFWEKPTAHQLELDGNHINTPIYGYCGLPLDQRCHKFRACYTCSHFAATPEKLPQYIKVRDELRDKKLKALNNGHDVLVEQFGRQADQLDKIITGLQGAA